MIAISIFLDILLTNIIKRNSILLPMLSLMSIIFIDKSNRNRYLLIVSIIGFIYDIFFSNFYILNTIVFFILGILTYYFYKRVKQSVIINVIYSIILIFLYQLLIYIIYNTTKYNIINLNEFLFIIYHYFILNIIYVIIISIYKKRTSK